MYSDVPMLRTSERKSFKRCPQQWWWGYRQGLVSPKVKADALWFGIGMHIALQERYKHKGKRRGANMLKVWRDYVNDEVAYVKTLPLGYADEEAVYVDAKELGEAMIGAYLDHYGKDERWYVISAEQTFQIPIPYPARQATKFRRNGNPDKPLVIYAGTFDLVARDEESMHDDLWLWDHKNVKAIQTGHLPLDDQAGSYWAVASDVLAHQGLIGKNDKLEGILFNFLRKAKPDPRPTNEKGEHLNKDGTVSKVQPATLFRRETVTRTQRERLTQIRRIQDEALIMQAVRRKQLPLVKNTSPDCFYGCPFYDMCTLHEEGDDWEEFRDSMFKVRDPYADHRKSAAE